MDNKHGINNSKKCGRIIFMITSTFALLAVVMASLLLTAGTTEGKEAKSYKRYYASMSVSEGETLWDLGIKYSGETESQKEYADNIKKINNMTDDTLYEGMNIVYYYIVSE